MSERPILQPDSEAIGQFVTALFRDADAGSYVSLRAFYDDADGVAFPARAILCDDLAAVAAEAVQVAQRAANAPRPVVFASPVATFTNPDKADEASLANGVALSVECDATPDAARARLEALLGPATVVVASGGEWPDPATGEMQPKLHLHWRLTEPTREAADHATLKLARQLAQRLVGADASNTPSVHPIRWPGSWHRKNTPRLARIVAINEAREIDLQDALGTLQEAIAAAGVTIAATGGKPASTGTPEARETADLVRLVKTAEDYHTPLAALAMRLLKGGTCGASRAGLGRLGG